MKHILFICICSLFALQAKAQNMEYDEPAEFPGGRSAMVKYMSENLHYPKIELENPNEMPGKCWVDFIVEVDGSITEVKIMRSSGFDSWDKEFMRFTASMPRWTPARLNGKSVRSSFSIPFSIHFQ